ncbi:uncharacterized protein LOC123867662 [Maniola jurtina]|uniref:uncharacterized protein LOC123867662 n=1 Tax=Maniola jurtina TaxID=191418 RepID=UPI001E68CD96|nr:uncharacterized protein LOC123867662 [Maniola jurtina]
MVRKYKKLAGAREYKNYTQETLEEALEKITDGEMSINAAAINYKIPFGTLYNKYKGMHGSTPGGQPVFSHSEEVAILRAAATCADWGFPLTTFDLRMFAKSYLDQQGRNVTRFSNNIPGIDWALSVLKRHKNGFGQRLATNIKRARAAVDRNSINTYFDNLQREVVDIPPSNIFNYDESNLSDDPGKKKCIYRRGVKYPEKIMNHSKSCTTIMICGSADGTLLPPYVIYKSLHLYDTWKERGIVGYPCCTKPCCSRGSRFNRTTSGWIDAPTFRDWFITSFLPHADRLDGRKVLIGDNLSSHLDSDVLEKCQSHNISFICLVPNSTHICQPLDVGFFRPMKTAWRKTLEEWKKFNLKAGTVPKEAFPRLLKQSIMEMDKVQPATASDEEAITSAVKRNLISSFKATGIFPFNRDSVLRKIPDNSPEAQNRVEGRVRDSLTDFLKEQRFGKTGEPTRKKKRLQIGPGKSIATLDEPGPSTASEAHLLTCSVDASPISDFAEAGPSTMNPTEDFDNDPIQDPLCPQLPLKDKTPEYEDEITDCESVADDRRIESPCPETGKFVLAKFTSKKGKRHYQYVCMIEDISEEKIVVLGFKSHKRNKTVFRAVNDDVSIIEKSDIITYLPQPILREGFYVFPQDVNVKEL